MFAHRSIQPIEALHIEIDLPPEFADCREAEVIVLPARSESASKKIWDERVRALSGTLSSDFPDEIDDLDLGQNAPRAHLE
ncbi:hypothetical protein G3480_15500 [Thiorhodococcus mannitoliphagus]|uniref:Uncharacterized protein n=1 Tax=Thiorhodococcus mannitoliphagus TaxID=329406 RepID=A0A6P1DVF7_9GAMM|nr:hypothetical protein [Thiorhodococcus mannitoliphagus]NEX21699.1 hypothetical protein [Thiorhodococcus mannitoliphagus]